MAARAWQVAGPVEALPRGRAWYGNYTGPGNERSDWEEEHLPPMTPLDRAPMQHDQDYSGIEERYGYGHYETGPDGRRRWRGGENSFITMRFDTEHESLHTSLIDSDARLMWRSGWYVAEGLGGGDYDLTFSRGPRGVLTLGTDLLVFGIIQGVFPLLIGIDVAFLGLTAAKHGAQELGRLVRGFGSLAASSSPTWDGGDFIPKEWKQEWDRWVKEYEAAFWRYKPFPNATTGWKGDFFGYGSWEIGIRNVTMLDIAIFALTPGLYGVYSGTATVAEYALGWALGKAAKKITQNDAIIAPAASWARELGGGLSRASEKASRQGEALLRGAERHGRDIGAEANRLGGRASAAAKAAGGRVSDWAKATGGSISRGAKDAGRRVSDAWKGGGGGGGGCFLTSACVRSLQPSEGNRVLDVLRAFRDAVLLHTERGVRLVGEYYSLAPEIVERIDSSADPQGEYERVYREVVLPAFRLIAHGRHAQATALYARGVQALVARWLHPKLVPSPRG